MEAFAKTKEFVIRIHSDMKKIVKGKLSLGENQPGKWRMKWKTVNP